MYNQPDSPALKQDGATSPVSSEGVTNFLEWSSMMTTRTVLKASRGSALLAVFVMLSAVSFAAESSVETNVVFATYSGLALLMDVYRPATSNGLGIVVINGSGWYRDLGYDANLLKQSQEFRPVTQKLVTAGYTVFVITHRASPRFHIPDIIEDV